MVFAVVSVLCIGTTLLGVKYTQTPPNRGGLTVAEFSENYNYYFNQLIDQNSTGLPTLSEEGRWVEREEAYGTVTINIFGDTTVWDDPVFTVTGGRVTAVELHMESEDTLVSGSTRELLVLLAMTGSLDGLNLFNYDIKSWAVMADHAFEKWTDQEVDYRGLRLVQRVEYDGYSNAGSQLWWEDEDAPRHCEKTVIISLLEEPQ